MKPWISLIAVLISINLFSQKQVLSKLPGSGKSITAFIPNGYDTIATASGDLNKDKVDDVVIVLRSLKEENVDAAVDDIDSLPSRLLVVLFKTVDGYRLAGKSDAAIMCKYCGGVFGDPFAGIDIEKGILILHHFGGSAWRWSYTHKFRYQKDDFYLIGETSNSFWTIANCEELGLMAATDYKDVNFVTGQYEEKQVSEEGCKLLVNKKGKMKVKPLKKLTAFSIEN